MYTSVVGVGVGVCACVCVCEKLCCHACFAEIFQQKPSDVFACFVHLSPGKRHTKSDAAG